MMIMFDLALHQLQHHFSSLLIFEYHAHHLHVIFDTIEVNRKWWSIDQSFLKKYAHPLLICNKTETLDYQP